MWVWLPNRQQITDTGLVPSVVSSEFTTLPVWRGWQPLEQQSGILLPVSPCLDCPELPRCEKAGILVLK